MRSLILLVAACGGSTATTKPDPVPTPPTRPSVDAKPDEPPRAPVDPIAVLAPVEGQQTSFISPGAIQLELGGAGIESPGGNRPIPVALVDRQGTQIRVVVRLEHARFSLWSAGARLFGVIMREQRVKTMGAINPRAEMHVSLRPGARVQRLAHKHKQTQIRYVGALQVEGWVPDEALADSGPATQNAGRRLARGRRPLIMLPGSIIRSEPKFGTNELALTTSGHWIDPIKELADGWTEVTYSDGDVSVHGYTSKRMPPGRVHRLQDPDVPPPKITPNTKVASGTCLYSKRAGDPIGYIVGDRDVQLDDLGAGWWTLAVDTPWGPIPFAAKGPTHAGLTACAPAGSVPPAGGSTPPTP